LGKPYEQTGFAVNGDESNRFTTPTGGAVFSVGSIAWWGSLAYAGYDNDVSRITANVHQRIS